MVKVKVVFYATFREKFKVNEIDLDIDGTFKSLMDSLTNNLGEEVKKELYDDNTNYIKKDVIMLVNGRSVEYLGGPSVKFNDGDKIAIFPPVAGG
ncbi:MAG: MoaD family protein [Thermoprotei archaeon]|jgi:MoaD family protein